MIDDKKKKLNVSEDEVNKEEVSTFNKEEEKEQSLEEKLKDSEEKLLRSLA